MHVLWHMAHFKCKKGQVSSTLPFKYILFVRRGEIIGLPLWYGTVYLGYKGIFIIW